MCVYVLIPVVMKDGAEPLPEHGVLGLGGAVGQVRVTLDHRLVQAFPEQGNGGLNQIRLGVEHGGWANSGLSVGLPNIGVQGGLHRVLDRLGGLWWRWEMDGLDWDGSRRVEPNVWLLD